MSETAKQETLAEMNKKDALRLKAGDGVHYGDHVMTQKCSFMRKAVVRSVAADGTVRVERLSEADKPTGELVSVSYKFLAYRFEFRK